MFDFYLKEKYVKIISEENQKLQEQLQEAHKMIQEEYDQKAKITIKAKTFFYTEENPHPVYGPCTSNFDGIPGILTEKGIRPCTGKEKKEKIKRRCNFYGNGRLK
jgi:hypothetical protein